MPKNQENEAVFSALEAMLVLMIVAIIGIAGWLVYENRRYKAEPMKNAATTTQASAVPVFNALPNGWAEYKGDENSLRLGLPKAWGMFDPIELHTPNYRDDTKDLQGQLVVALSRKDGFTVMARKYGAIISPSGDGKSWVVSDENPAAVDGYKVGDTYKTTEEQVNGGKAIDLGFVDEECTQARWLLELKNSYAIVTIPELCPTNLQPISDANKTAYSKLMTEFLNTITVY